MRDIVETHRIGAYIATATYSYVEQLPANDRSCNADYPAVSATLNIPCEALAAYAQSRAYGDKLSVCALYEDVGPAWGEDNGNSDGQPCRARQYISREKTLLESLAIARSAVAEGIESIRARAAQRAERLASATATNPFAD